MAGTKTNYARNKIMDALMRGQVSALATALPATWYIGLFISMPTQVGTDGTETSYTNYTRIAVTNALTAMSGTQGAGTTTASTGTSGTISNNADLTFPTAASSGGTAVGVGWWDAASGGNLWFYGTIPTPQAIANGNTPYYPAGTLNYQEDV